ncbi:MAG: hypothetical protein WC796_04910 [Candidatus Pacearchaeota archaeon]|jgi:general stress protein CsbA
MKIIWEDDTKPYWRYSIVFIALFLLLLVIYIFIPGEFSEKFILIILLVFSLLISFFFMTRKHTITTKEGIVIRRLINISKQRLIKWNEITRINITKKLVSDEAAGSYFVNFIEIYTGKINEKIGVWDILGFIKNLNSLKKENLIKKRDYDAGTRSAYYGFFLKGKKRIK